MPIDPLLAAGNDWVVGLTTLAIMVFIWVFKRLIAQMSQPGPQGPQQQRGQRIPPAGVPKPADEVQEFLRRVQQRRREAEGVELIRPPQQQPPRPATRPPSQSRPARSRAPLPSGERVGPGSPQGSSPQTTPARPISAPPRQRLESRIAEHVARDIDTTDVTEHVARLSKLDQADEQMEAHIKSAFTRKLGQFDSSESEELAEPQAGTVKPSSAAVIRALLASPDGARQAVLMREILARPVERW